MTEVKNDAIINLKYILATIVAVLFTWIVHEFCHWIAGRCLGYQMAMTLNSAYPTSNGGFRHDWEYQVSGSAGPIFTIIEAIAIYSFMQHKRVVLLYSALFICFLSRFGATMLSFKVNNLNDEARISKYLGIGTFTLPVIVTLFLFALLAHTTIRYKLNPKFVFFNFLLSGSLIYSLVQTHNHFHWRLL